MVTMEFINNPDHYICFKKAQFKTPVEILKKNFKNLQRLIERQNYLINKTLERINSSTDNKIKLDLINNLIEKQEIFDKKINIRIKQHNDNINKLIIRINKITEIKELYEKFGNLSKKKLSSSKNLPKELIKFYQNENNLIIIEYLLLNDFKNAIKITENLKLENFIDIEIIQQGLTIKNEIINNKNLKLLKLWCLENKKQLNLLRIQYPHLINSDIEFECNFQEFIELINVGDYGKAIVYARKNLLNNEVCQNFEKISKGSSVIWSKFIIDSINQKINLKDFDIFYYYNNSMINNKSSFKILNVYTKLLSNKRWQDLGDFFLLNFKLLYGMNQFSTLETLLCIGGSVLKTKSCCSHSSTSNIATSDKDNSDNNNNKGFEEFINKESVDSSKKIQNFINASECPICSIELNLITDTLPFSLQPKSNIFEDPVILPNKNVYSYKQLMFFNKFKFNNDYGKFNIDGIVGERGEFDINEFNLNRIEFPDLSLFKVKIQDPITNELFTIGSLEKVFPT
jgi:macrophage erythroblast attacher